MTESARPNRPAGFLYLGLAQSVVGARPGNGSIRRRHQQGLLAICCTVSQCINAVFFASSVKSLYVALGTISNASSAPHIE